MIVTRENCLTVVSKLCTTGIYAVDTETTGLRREDRLFSIVIADQDEVYYFNFNENAPIEYRLSKNICSAIDDIFKNPESTFILHNAKFDMHMLAKEDIYIQGHVWDTMCMERVLHNNYFGKNPYSLDACAQRRGLKKDEAVENYIEEHKLVTPAKEGQKRLKHFDRVPFEIMQQYASHDAVITRQIYLHQLTEIQAQNLEALAKKQPQIDHLIANEQALSKTCFRMEDIGVPIDREYTKRALAHTEMLAQTAAREFQRMCGLEYGASPTILKKAFEIVGVELPKTPTGKPCTKAEVLEELDNPLAAQIRSIRGFEKLCSTYFKSFLHFVDEHGRVHPNMRQSGTITGRFSYSDPNFQNVPKEDDPEDFKKPYLVRRCVVPDNPDFCLVPIDYQQQEYRIFLDYAGETRMIEAVMNGADVHQATADILGITRGYAKTLNFGLLYGMGNEKLAKSLGISFPEAVELKNKLFQEMPRVRKLLRGVSSTGEIRGFVRNWFGYRNNISNPDFSYQLVNHLIQGSGAQVVRIAMNRIDNIIRTERLRSQLILQVHDELVLLMHKNEFEYIPIFKGIMESIYPPRNGMKLTCSVEHSWKSWAKADLVKGMPCT